MAPREIALFPLANVVLFPEVQTPLHLFEPRYRQLADHVLAGSREIGMVAVPAEHAAGMAGDPPLYPIGCAGSVARAQRLPDGRYNIVLSGSHRFRIESELPRSGERLYRMARVETLSDPFPEGERERVAELRARIIELVARLVRQGGDPAGASRVAPEHFADVDDVLFVNSLCNALPFASEERQGLLEAETVPGRFARLEGLLSFRTAELATGAVSGPSRVH